MTEQVLGYPLQWPEGKRRTANPSNARPFKTSLSVAISNVRKALGAFGKDTGLVVDSASIVFSSNFGGGLEAKRPRDPGVAVWFTWDKEQRCIPVDRYDDIAQNVQAIYHLIEADRTKMRYGELDIVRASYKGFTALAAPSGESWREVLGLAAGDLADKASVDSLYRKRAKESHPNAPGGSEAALKRLNIARTDAYKALGYQPPSAEAPQ